jgi:uncharacterized protein (TIGR00730 family)
MSAPPFPIASVCVYCGSSDAADPAYMEAAAAFGKALADGGLRLVYGGGGVGLMGACARAAHGAGGKVLGVMPDFLRQLEILFDDVETIVVRSMHERKMIMFERADAFVTLPGGIGTLEEVIELLSWRRMELHRKPIVFYNPDGFWEPLFALLRHTVAMKLAPEGFLDTWRSVETVEAILPAVKAMAVAAGAAEPLMMTRLV